MVILFFLVFASHYAKLKRLEDEREAELAQKYRDRVSFSSFLSHYFFLHLIVSSDLFGLYCCVAIEVCYFKGTCSK